MRLSSLYVCMRKMVRLHCQCATLNQPCGQRWVDKITARQTTFRLKRAQGIRQTEKVVYITLPSHLRSTIQTAFVPHPSFSTARDLTRESLLGGLAPRGVVDGSA